MCLYICHFLWLLPFKHDSMTYQVQIKFMNFQRRYLVRIIQLLSLNVVVILFQPLRFLPFTFSSSLFLAHFNLSKVINIVRLHKLLRDNTVPRKFSCCLVVSRISSVLVEHSFHFSFGLKIIRFTTIDRCC